ncbi:hypothetical protein SpCBS45565_g05267 [Spizellomyces sp. 'palustris']|nr:hypothetical protein SpCBS45565_g05267 [Spizellomyces sp. 'palustris']
MRHPSYTSQTPDASKTQSYSNLYSGPSSNNLYRPPSTSSLYSAPSSNSLFQAPPAGDKQQSTGNPGQLGAGSYNYYKSSGGNSGFAAGGSLPNLNDPEAGLDSNEPHLERGRRPSMLQVFGSELKKSWASLGSLTAQAATALMGTNNPLSRESSSTDILPGSGYNPRGYDEESGASMNAGNPNLDSNMPGGLFSYLSSPRGSVVATDQHILPRHTSSRQQAAGRKQSILPS